MANKPNIAPMYVRAIPPARTALKKLLADMEERDRRVNQEVFVTASWLWMEKLEADHLYSQVAPFVETVIKLRDAEKAAKKAEKAAKVAGRSFVSHTEATKALGITDPAHVTETRILEPKTGKRKRSS